MRPLKFHIDGDEACYRRVWNIINATRGGSPRPAPPPRGDTYYVRGLSFGGETPPSPAHIKDTATSINIDWLRSNKYPTAHALKFFIGHDEEASRAIQEALFDMGAYWAMPAPQKVKYTDLHFLYVSETGEISAAGGRFQHYNYENHHGDAVDVSWIVKPKPAESRWARPEPQTDTPARRVGDWVFSERFTPSGKPLYYRKTRS